MILKLVLSPIFMLLNGVVDIIPGGFMTEGFDISGIIFLISQAFVIFPYDLFQLIIGNVMFWLELQFVWAIVEWVYKKIPGVS